MKHTAKELAQLLFEVEEHKMNFSQETVDMWKEKIPSLGNAIEKLNGTMVKSKIANFPDIIEEILEKWKSELLAEADEKINQLQDRIERSTLVYFLTMKDIDNESYTIFPEETKRYPADLVSFQHGFALGAKYLMGSTWMKEQNEKLGSLLRETIMRSHFAFPMSEHDKKCADEGFMDSPREYTVAIGEFLTSIAESQKNGKG